MKPKDYKNDNSTKIVYSKSASCKKNSGIIFYAIYFDKIYVKYIGYVVKQYLIVTNDFLQE